MTEQHPRNERIMKQNDKIPRQNLSFPSCIFKSFCSHRTTCMLWAFVDGKSLLIWKIFVNKDFFINCYEPQIAEPWCLPPAAHLHSMIAPTCQSGSREDIYIYLHISGAFFYPPPHSHTHTPPSAHISIHQLSKELLTGAVYWAGRSTLRSGLHGEEEDKFKPGGSPTTQEWDVVMLHKFFRERVWKSA